MQAATSSVQNVETSLSTVPAKRGQSQELMPLTVSSDMCLVRYDRLQEMMRPKVPKTVRLQLAATWIVVVIGAFGIFALFTNQFKLRDTSSAQEEAISTLGTNVGTVQGKMDTVAKDMGKLTDRMMELSQQVDEQTAATQGLRDELSKAAAVRKAAIPIAAAKATTIGAPTVVTVIGQSAAPREEESASGVANGKTVPSWHVHNVDMTIAPVKGAVIHFNAADEKDYWLLTRVSQSGARLPVRVLPFETTAAGIRVHCMDDGIDYTVSPSGEWLNN